MRYPNIEAERARAGLSKAALAKVLGVSPKTLYNWDRANCYPISRIQQMAELFGVSVEYLLKV